MDFFNGGSNEPHWKVVQASEIYLEFGDWLAHESNFFNIFDDLAVVYTCVKAETFSEENLEQIMSQNIKKLRWANMSNFLVIFDG